MNPIGNITLILEKDGSFMEAESMEPMYGRIGRRIYNQP